MQIKASLPSILIILSILLFLINYSKCQTTLTINTTNYLVRSTSLYTFSLIANPILTINPSSNITILFPNDYPVQTNKTCDSLFMNSNSVQTFTYLTENNTIKITNIVQTSTQISNITFSISKVVNPALAGQTSQFIILLETPQSTYQTNQTIVLQPSNFLFCEVSFPQLEGNVRGNLYFELARYTGIYEIQDYYVIITLPKKWTKNGENNVIEIGTTGEMGACELTGKSVACQVSYVDNNIKVRIGNIFDGGEKLEFGILGVLTPLTEEAIDKIYVESFSLNGRPIDTCNLSPTGITPTKISTISTTSDLIPFPSTETPLTLSFNLPKQLISTDIISINFTNDYSPSFNFINIAIFNDSAALPFLIVTHGLITSFTLPNPLPQSTLLRITINNIIIPPSFKLYPYFQIQITNSGYPRMFGEWQVPIREGIVGAITGKGEGVAGEQNKYYLSFEVNTNWKIGAIDVQLPTQLEILPTVTVILQVNPSILIPCTVLENSILRLTINFSLPANVSLIISPIKNPETTLPISGTIFIHVYQSLSLDTIGKGNGTVSMKYGEVIGMMSGTAWTSSNITGYHPVDLNIKARSILGISLERMVKISLNGISLIELYDSASALSSRCTINAITQPCKIFNNSIFVTLLTSPVLPNSEFTLSLKSMFSNPPTNSSTLSYVTISTLSLSSSLTSPSILESHANPLQIENIKIGSSLSAWLLYSRTNKTNSASASYIFYLHQLQALLPGINTIVVTFGNDFYIDSGSCLECEINIEKRTFTFEFKNKMQYLQINDIKNTDTLQQNNQISVSTLNNYLNLYAQMDNLQNYVQNEMPNELQIHGYNWTSNIYGETATLTFNLSLLKPSASILTLALGPSFPSFTPLCTTIPSTVSCASTLISSVSISLPSPCPSSMSITISQINLPLSATFINPILTTETASKYLISSNILPTWKSTCNLPCKTCTSNLQECLSCYQNIAISSMNLYDSINKQCRYQCLETQIKIANECIPCVNCKACITTTTKCLSCLPETYLLNEECRENCPDTYYPSPFNNTCNPCISPCENCVNNLQCLTCVEGFYYFKGKCAEYCPRDVTIEDMDNRVCLICNLECKTCEISIDQCTSCSENFAMQNNKCVSPCSSGYIYQNQCLEECSEPCVTCHIYSTYCLSCQTPFLFYHNKCLRFCPQKTYLSPSIAPTLCLECADLSINCDDCESPLTCRTCNIGYVMFGKFCVKPEELPLEWVNVGGIAKKCHENCLTCMGTVLNCTTCSNDYLFYNGVCGETCPQTHTPTNTTCIPCPTPCQTCQSETPTNCLSCLPSTLTFLNNNTCSLTCPSTFFASTQNQRCMECKDPCFECTKETVCSSCIEDWLFDDGRCLKECFNGMYAKDGVCVDCINPCRECKGSEICQSCVENFYFMWPNSCVVECPDGFIVNYEYQMCVGCTAPCLACDQDTCFRCSAPSILYEGRCVENCPDIMYKYSSSPLILTCEICPPQCSTCLNETFCFECAGNFMWLDGSEKGICTDVCPANRPIIRSNGCEPCGGEDCIECAGNNMCLECTNTSILFNGFCLKECPSTHYFNESSQECELKDIPKEEQQVEEEISEQETIIMPFPIFFCVLGSLIGVLFGLFAYRKGFDILGILAVIWGIVESVTLIVTIIGYSKFFGSIVTGANPFGFLMIACLVWLLGVNSLTVYFSIFKTLLPDQKFTKWMKTASNCSYFLIFSSQTLTLLNFKCQHLMWSKISGSPKLESAQKLRFIKYMNMLSLLFSIGFIVTFIFLFYYANEILLFWVDAMIVVLLSMFFGLLALKKDAKMFEERTEDAILHRRHLSSDEFLRVGMKPTYREEDGVKATEYKSMNGSSVGSEAQSEASSSRLDLRTSSREFFSSRLHPSFDCSSKSKIENMEGFSENNSSFSREPNQGSLEQSQGWNEMLANGEYEEKAIENLTQRNIDKFDDSDGEGREMVDEHSQNDQKEELENSRPPQTEFNSVHSNQLKHNPYQLQEHNDTKSEKVQVFSYTSILRSRLSKPPKEELNTDFENKKALNSNQMLNENNNSESFPEFEEGKQLENEEKEEKVSSFNDFEEDEKISFKKSKFCENFICEDKEEEGEESEQINPCNIEQSEKLKEEEHSSEKYSYNFEQISQSQNTEINASILSIKESNHIHQEIPKTNQNPNENIMTTELQNNIISESIEVLTNEEESMDNKEFMHDKQKEKDEECHEDIERWEFLLGERLEEETNVAKEEPTEQEVIETEENFEKEDHFNEIEETNKQEEIFEEENQESFMDHHLSLSKFNNEKQPYLDVNKFSITTKKKKQNEPKVIIVDSKKFIKLKKTVKSIKKEEKEEERILNDFEKLNSEVKSIPEKRSKSKEQQLMEIYMKPRSPHKNIFNQNKINQKHEPSQKSD